MADNPFKPVRKPDSLSVSQAVVNHAMGKYINHLIVEAQTHKAEVIADQSQRARAQMIEGADYFYQQIPEDQR